MGACCARVGRGRRLDPVVPREPMRRLAVVAKPIEELPMLVSRRGLLKSVALAAVVSGVAGGAAFAATVKVALVLPGSITDGGWNQGAYEGLKSLEAKGFK